MVKKIVFFTTGLVLFLLCSCVGADVPSENKGSFDAIPANHEETNETFDYDEIGETINEITNEITTTTPGAISIYQEPNYTKDEQSVIDQCRLWCQGCEPLYIDGEYIPVCVFIDQCKFWCQGCEPLYINGEYMPSCGLLAKYTFFFFNDINRWDEWDVKIIDNWWRPDDTRPSRGYSSDSLAGLFVFQNDRIVITFDGSASVDGIFSIPTPIIELTTTQWDNFGVQIFQYAGDVTLIGMLDTLSQMPELQDDDFAHRLRTDDWQESAGRELLYIYYHELPESKLWNMLMGLEHN